MSPTIYVCYINDYANSDVRNATLDQAKARAWLDENKNDGQVIFFRDDEYVDDVWYKAQGQDNRIVGYTLQGTWPPTP